MEKINLQVVQIERPDKFDLNIIIGMSHFIKTVEDIYEAITNVNPKIKFGLAFCEASGPRLIRTCGTDKKLIDLALKNAQKIGAGHSFILILDETFPVNIMHSLRTVPEIINIFCATSNPLQVIVGESEQGRGILGIIDGGLPLGVETNKDVKERKKLLREVLRYKS